ncbi:Clavaminate synthase-like protein [Thozetella sp. PMI_491]|nr:Clavaminate synthase-like protein [Thozetella sp. PMI_491]
MAPGKLVDDDWNTPVLNPQASVNSTRAATLPELWPVAVAGELVWTASDYQSPDSYTLTLTPEDIREIHEGLNYFHELGLDGDEAQPETFPLPQLALKLSDCARQVHQGRGFVNIRGLNPADFSAEDNAIVFLGISSYIGEARGKQDDDGNMIMHLYDVKETHTPQSVRPTRYSNKASTYHTDTFCDILALQTRSKAANGGQHSIASSWTVYNQMAATRPDLVKKLAEPIWYFDSRSKLVGPNCRPLLFYIDNRIIINFAREPLVGIKGATRPAELPGPNLEQFQALDLVEKCAAANELMLDLHPGDMTFINNNGILHSRQAFQDNEDSKRHLVRLWLKNKALAWELPRELQYGNSRLFEPNEINEIWAVKPIPRVVFSLAERLCS